MVNRPAISVSGRSADALTDPRINAIAQGTDKRAGSKISDDTNCSFSGADEDVAVGAFEPKIGVRADRPSS